MSVAYKANNDIGTIELDMTDSKVNLLTAETIAKLNEVLDEVKGASIKALVIVSKKKDVFVAGADIKEIDAIIESEDGVQKAKAGQAMLNKIEDLPMPSIAVIDGLALGGGCELALACKYRIGTFNEKLRIGLPEVNLGIVPGFGGTYRMPRVVGLIEGLKLVSSGRPIDAKKALKVGLFDRLYPQVGLSRSIEEFVEEISKNGKIKRKKKKGLYGFLEKNRLGHFVVFTQAEAQVQKITKGFYPAPAMAIEVIKKNFYMDRERGLDLEANVFSKLVVTDVSKRLVGLFYASEKFRKLSPKDLTDTKPKEINKCCVLGAGVMGGGIAQLLSSKDIWTRIKDINYDAISLGYKSANKVYSQAVKRRKLTKAEAQRKMAKISSTVDYSGFNNTDIVIEAVVENMDIKKQVFKELSDVVSTDTVLCTNTSALSVTEMAKETKDPSKVIGLHFFNPVHKMPLIEIITTDETSKETLSTTLAFVKKLRKTPIIVKDRCGFLVNRVLLGYINEAGRILEEGGDIKVIDRTMEKFGMPMGPFNLSDEVGLDVGFKVLKILEDGLGARFKPVDIFKDVFEAGLYGKKSEEGFYVYGKKRIVNSKIAPLVKKKDAKGVDSPQDFENRMIFIMINEAARCLEERIVDGPDTVDIGMIMGTGFPAFRGGLLKHADLVGTKTIVDALTLYQSRFGDDRFKPCDYLVELGKNEGTFYGD